MEDSGHKTVAISMNKEKEFKEAVANDLIFYINEKINQMLDLVERGGYNLRHIINCENIIKYHDKLIKKYENIKLKLENLDPKLITDNGTITQILNHKKFYKSMTYWFGIQ